MDQMFACVLLLLSSSATASKYVFISNLMSWHDAQVYCRSNHTDLAPVSNAEDMDKLQSLFWIGLERDQANRSRWRWSGGGEVTTFFWDSSQPDHTRIRFLCFSAVVVRERKTWEEALEHCRERQRNLTSVTSKTEMELIRKEAGEDVSVWIALRFFTGRWLWVDGRPLTYEAWGGGGAPVCPAFNMDCVSLRASGGAGSNANKTGTHDKIGKPVTVRRDSILFATNGSTSVMFLSLVY